MEDFHAKQGHSPARNGDDDNAYYHGKMAARYHGQNLATDDAVYHAIPDIGEEVQDNADFAGIVAHEISGHDLSDS